jgi:hypothetical protein
VRARLGHLVAHPRAVEVAVRDGEVELAGPVFRAEHARALRGARAIRGVRGVHDRLRPHERGEGVPELQGRGPLAPGRGSALPASAATLAVAVGSVAAARAFLGRRLLGVPAIVAGAALARGAARGSASRSRHLARLAAREVSRDAEHAREREADREAHSGAWHPEPEVREVKSPAELEAGVAHGSPEPTFPDRVSRRASRRGDPGGGAGGGRGQRAAATREPGDDPPVEDPSLGEPMPRAGFDAPPPGAGVREHDLGAVPGPDELEPGEGGTDGGEGGSER